MTPSPLPAWPERESFTYQDYGTQWPAFLHRARAAYWEARCRLLLDIAKEWGCAADAGSYCSMCRTISTIGELPEAGA